MNIFFRISLAFYAFCLTVISLVLMFITVVPSYYNGITNYIGNEVILKPNGRIGLFGIELIIFCLSIIFLLSGFKSEKEKKAVSKFTNIGEIKISLVTIENIAFAASKKFNGVKESKAYVKKVSEGVTIFIRIVVMPDINIPTLLEDIQVKVKRAVEDSTGVKVNEVSAAVDNIYSGYKSRVE